MSWLRDRFGPTGAERIRPVPVVVAVIAGVLVAKGVEALGVAEWLTSAVVIPLVVLSVLSAWPVRPRTKTNT